MRKTERLKVFTQREGPGVLVHEKRVLIRIFGTVLKTGRQSASNSNRAFF
jgi:hypothetical protein